MKTVRRVGVIVLFVIAFGLCSITSEAWDQATPGPHSRWDLCQDLGLDWRTEPLCDSDNGGGDGALRDMIEKALPIGVATVDDVHAHLEKYLFRAQHTDSYWNEYYAVEQTLLPGTTIAALLAYDADGILQGILIIDTASTSPGSAPVPSETTPPLN